MPVTTDTKVFFTEFLRWGFFGGIPVLSPPSPSPPPPPPPAPSSSISESSLARITKRPARRRLISTCDQSPISAALQVITRILWRRRKPFLAGVLRALDPFIDWRVNTGVRRRRRRSHTLFVCESRVFSGGPRGSNLNQDRRAQNVRHRQRFALTHFRFQTFIHSSAINVNALER